MFRSCIWLISPYLRYTCFTLSIDSYMKRWLVWFMSHLGLFVIIEILFVFVLFREFPEIWLLSQIGIAHLSYWVILLLSAFFRHHVRTVFLRFLATYIPVVFHLVVHLWIGVETLHSLGWWHEGEVVWLIVWVIWAWFLIFRGEMLIHRTYHCDTHHASLHDSCHDQECEIEHESR